MTILRRYWNTKITKTAKRAAGRAGVDPRTFRAAVQAFEDLRYEESPVLRRDVQSIICTKGRLFRQKSSRPLYLLHFRNIFAIVRQSRDDGKRGTLLLLAVLPRDQHTYTPEALARLIKDVIAEAQQERALATA